MRRASVQDTVRAPVEHVVEVRKVERALPLPVDTAGAHARIEAAVRVLEFLVASVPGYRLHRIAGRRFVHCRLY